MSFTACGGQSGKVCNIDRYIPYGTVSLTACGGHTGKGVTITDVFLSDVSLPETVISNIAKHSEPYSTRKSVF